MHDEREADQAAKRLVASLDRNAPEPALGGYGSIEGSALDPATRQRMEQHFDHDFGGIRLHADGAAAQAASSLSARAFAIGEHVYFGGESERGGEPRGRSRLLAHELAHVAQQSRRGQATVQAQGAPGAAPPGPIDQARSDVVTALAYTVERLRSAISARDSITILPHDVDDALCQFFSAFGPERLEDIVARIQPLSDWIPHIPASRVPRPAPAGFRDAALLNQIAWPAAAMVRRDLPGMDPGADYIALFPDWYGDPTLQATRFLHEAIHFSWPGMHHAGSWNNAFAWQGLISSLGGLTTGATLQGQFPPCP